MDFPIRAQTGMEALLMVLLPPQLHWLVLVFREAAETLWSWFPLPIIFYAVYQFMVYQISRKVAGLKTQDILTRILRDNNTSIEHILAIRAKDLVQRYSHATVTDMVARVTELKQMLSDAEKKSAATITDLGNELTTMSSDLRGKLSLPLRRAITEAVQSVAKSTISKATQDAINRLSLHSSFNKDSDIREMRRTVYGHQQSQEELRTKHDRLNTIVMEQARTIDMLTKANSTPPLSPSQAQIDQTEIITSLSKKLETLTAAHSATQTEQAGNITSLAEKVDSLTAAHASAQSPASPDHTETISLLLIKIDSLTANHAAAQAQQIKTIRLLNNRISELTAMQTPLQAGQSTQAQAIDSLVVNIDTLATAQSAMQATQAETVASMTDKIEAFSSSPSPLPADQSGVIAQLSSRVDTLATAHSASQEAQAKAVETLTADVSSLAVAQSATAAEATSLIASLATKANALAAEQATAEEQLRNLPEIISAIAGLQAVQEGFVADVREQSETSSDHVAKIVKRVKDLESELESVRQSTAGLQNRMNSFTVSANNAPDGAMSSRVSACEGRIQRMDRKIDGFLDDIQKHKNDFGEHEEGLRVQEVRDELDKQSRYLREDQEDIKSLQADLEAILNGGRGSSPSIPEMDTEFDEELLAGEERMESDEEEEEEEEEEEDYVVE